MLPWKLRKLEILPVNQNRSLAYFSLAKFQLVSCNLSLAMIWQMMYTHKMPKLCSATLTLAGHFTLAREHLKENALHAFSSIWKQTVLNKVNPYTASQIFDTMIFPILSYNSEVWGMYTKQDFKKWDSSPTEKFTSSYVNVT